MVSSKKKMITFLYKIINFLKNFKDIAIKLNEAKVLNGNILSEIKKKKIITQISPIMNSKSFPNSVKTESFSTW